MSEISYNLVRLTKSFAHCSRSGGKSPKTIERYITKLKLFTKSLSNNQLLAYVTEISKEEARLFIFLPAN